MDMTFTQADPTKVQKGQHQYKVRKNSLSYSPYEREFLTESVNPDNTKKGKDREWTEENKINS